MNLESAARAALARMQKEGVEGWGLYTPNAELEELGEFVQVGPVVGCFTDNCAHVSHDPAAPRRRWVPRVGTLLHLGDDGRSGYYVLRLPGRDLFLRLSAERFYHASLTIVAPEQIPEYLLARLSEAGER